MASCTSASATENDAGPGTIPAIPYASAFPSSVQIAAAWLHGALPASTSVTASCEDGATVTVQRSLRPFTRVTRRTAPPVTAMALF